MTPFQKVLAILLLGVVGAWVIGLLLGFYLGAWFQGPV